MKFFVGMSSGQRGDRRIEGGGIAESGIEISGGEGTGDASQGSGTSLFRSGQGRGQTPVFR